jgi:FkbM family methyltransferase
MKTIIHGAHVAVVGLIKRLPMTWGIFLCRVYNKGLRTIQPEYRARTYFGARLYCDPRDLIQRMILFFGVWEPDVSRVIASNLAPGDVFVDVGANVGYDTLLASERVGPRGRAVAIEASPRTFARLERNLALNHTSNVRAVNAAVFDRVAQLDLYEISEHNIGAATTLASRGGTLMMSVGALPLQQILEPDEISRVRLVKIDVEGAEPPILHQLLEQVALYPPTMDIVVEASPDDDREKWTAVFDRFSAAGFSAYEIANSYELEWYLRWRRPTPLRRVSAVPTRQVDLLFTRRASISP